MTIAILRAAAARSKRSAGRTRSTTAATWSRCSASWRRAVVKSGEPLWYAGSTEDLPPQIEQAIEEYVDQSYTKSLAVIPLRKPQAGRAGPTASSRPRSRSERTPGQIIGALIIEQIESDIPREILAPRLDLVYEHSARALSNAIDHNSLFLMPVWRTIGKSAVGGPGPHAAEDGDDHRRALLSLLAMIVVPWNFDMRAKGTLQPMVKREIFAPMPGDSAGSARSITATTVEEGETLAGHAESRAGAARSKQIEGEFEAATRSAASRSQHQHPTAAN